MPDNADLIAYTVTVVASFATHNRLPAEEVAAFIRATHAAIAAIDAPRGTSPAEALATRRPAVSVRQSLASPDVILSMIDGKPYKSLKRHLRAHGLAPGEYRTQFGLAPDYPMVAPGYSQSRRAIAVSLGLGRAIAGGRKPRPGLQPAAAQGNNATPGALAGAGGEALDEAAGATVAPAPSAVAAMSAGGQSAEPMLEGDTVQTGGTHTEPARKTLSISI
jgi:predicted transcriptional regulator